MCGTAFAAEDDMTYDEVYEDIGISELAETLPQEIDEILSSLGIDVGDYNSVLQCDINGVLSAFYSLSLNSIKAPLTVLLSGVALLLLAAMTGSVFSGGAGVAISYRYMCLLSIAAVVLLPVMNTVSACVTAVKTLSGFMVAFVPIFGAVLAYSGAPVTSAVYQSVMIVACQIVTQFFSAIITPLCSAYLCLGTAASASGIAGADRLAERVKSIVTVTVGLVMTVFTGFLSVQSTVSKSADSLAIKTARFVLSGGVPVVGGALGEALTTVTASISLLRSTVFFWGVAVVAATVLPILLKLFAWRIVLYILSAVSGLLSLNNSAKLFDIFSSAVGILVAVTATVAVTFILSLTAVRQVA